MQRAKELFKSTDLNLIQIANEAGIITILHLQECLNLMKLDIRVGEIVNVEFFEKARKPAYKLWVDFGNEIGIKKSSAQITECYRKEDLLSKQVLGVVLIQPEQSVKKGAKLG